MALGVGTLLAGTAGCDAFFGTAVGGIGEPCASNRKCREPLVCNGDNICSIPGVDGGARDRGAGDRAVADREGTDHALADRSTPDRWSSDRWSPDRWSSDRFADAISPDRRNDRAVMVDHPADTVSVDRAPVDVSLVDDGGDDVTASDRLASPDGSALDLPPPADRASDLASQTDPGAPDCPDHQERCAGVCAACPVAGVSEVGCRADLCVALSCVPGYHLCGSSCCAWSYTPVAEGNFGSIRHRPEAVRVAFKNTSSQAEYRILTAPVEAHIASFGEVDQVGRLVLDGDDAWVGINVNDNVRLFHWNGISWSNIGVASPSWSTPSVALNLLGLPRVVVQSSDTWTNALWSRNQTGQWSSQGIVEPGVGPLEGFAALLKLTAPDTAHVLVEATSPIRVRYARQEGSGWLVETVDTGVQLVEISDLVIDGVTGRVHVAYGLDNEVRYAQRLGPDSWQVETVAPYRVHSGGLALFDGQPQLVFCDTMGAVYARLTDRWELSFVADTAASFCEITLDSDGAPHILFRDNDTNMIYHVF